MAPQLDKESIEESAKLMAILKTSKVVAPPKYTPPTADQQKEIDSRSVHMANVDWNSTVAEIEQFYLGCGEIKRVTIPKCKFTGRQKNFCHIEFDSTSSVSNALVMNGAEFRGRKVAVVQKRTNLPGMNNHQGKTNGYQGKKPIVVKYVYVQGKAPPPRSQMSKRFVPY